jgi:Flp pilus assembly protein TadG
MIGRLRALARCEKGAAAVELAIVAPVLAMFVAGVADISIAYSRELEIEQAAQRAIEKVMQTSGNETPADAIQKEACKQINGAVSVTRTVTSTDEETGVTTTGPVTTIDCAEGRMELSDITVTFELTCDGAPVANYDSECLPTQTTSRYVSATVNDEYDPIFPISWGTNAEGVYELSTTAGVRVQ